MARNTRVLAALAALSLVVAACGGSSESSDTTAAAGGSLELVKDGSLTVCSDAPYEPFEFQAEDGTWTGFDMDVMRKIAEAMASNLKSAFSRSTASGLHQQLASVTSSHHR